ncbi:hypothetical protein QJS10_CPB11g01903 [Acorus calamus]|uniref:Autophagy-related protein 13 N-terminal domain-containing protein n=1 Tax=Acorus calamus TaxID=4465 RepID=A0AAV9DSB9_ACOCL|nr:hypothetical protein QJS10_CPB11g01903 [Acorus calamus]
MADSSSSSPSSTRSDQIISQFLLKSLHAILSSRVPRFARSPPSSSISKRDRWFNLALPDLPSPSMDSLSFWHRSVSDPMIIDILLHSSSSASAGAGTIIERWTVQHEPSPSPLSLRSDDGYRRTYKKSIVLLRLLYSSLRLLPAHRLHRRLIGPSIGPPDLDVSYRVSTFGEPLSRDDEDSMRTHALSPVETPSGHLSVSVLYRPSLSDLDRAVSAPLPPQIIMDYVGSPASVDPMKVSTPGRGFTRPHSWSSGGIQRPRSQHMYEVASSPPMAAHRKWTSFDEHQLSPPFSPSPSPSPPMRGAKFRCESAPVSIPFQGRNLGHGTPNSSDPTRHLYPPPSPRTTRTDFSSSPSESKSFRREGSLGLSNLHGLLGPKALKDGRDDSGRFSGVVSSSGSPRVGVSRSSSRLSFQDDLDECEFSCPFAVDDVDTSDSQTSDSVPVFIRNWEGTGELQDLKETWRESEIRGKKAMNLDGKEAAESFQAFMSARKSQDAAVGVLVHMLRTAPPLRQDHSYSSQSSRSEFEGDVGSSSFFVPRKASDALEELRSYREMKEMLLSQSGTQLQGSFKQGPK